MLTGSRRDSLRFETTQFELCKLRKNVLSLSGCAHEREYHSNAWKSFIDFCRNKHSTSFLERVTGSAIYSHFAVFGDLSICSYGTILSNAFRSKRYRFLNKLRASAIRAKINRVQIKEKGNFYLFKLQIPREVSSDSNFSENL